MEEREIEQIWLDYKDALFCIKRKTKKNELTNSGKFTLSKYGQPPLNTPFKILCFSNSHSCKHKVALVKTLCGGQYKVYTPVIELYEQRCQYCFNKLWKKKCTVCGTVFPSSSLSKKEQDMTSFL